MNKQQQLRLYAKITTLTRCPETQNEAFIRMALGDQFPSDRKIQKTVRSVAIEISKGSLGDPFKRAVKVVPFHENMLR